MINNTQNDISEEKNNNKLNDGTEEKKQNNSKKYEEPSSKKTIENMTHDVHNGVVVPKVNNNPCEQNQFYLNMGIPTSA